MPRSDDGPAFPKSTVQLPNGEMEYGADGMSLRDYFATHALPTMLADFDYEKAVEHAYKIADIMLAEREK